jgi:hypothetical protein
MSTRLKQAYNILSNTIRASEADQNGPLEAENLIDDVYLSRNDIKGFFKTHFVPYMTGIAFVTPPTDMWISYTPAGVKMPNGQFNRGAYCLNNGMCFYFMSYTYKYYYILVDLNGPSKPNKVGHDIFYFALHFSDKGAYLDGLVWEVTNKTTTDALYSTLCNTTDKGWPNGSRCTEIIIRNNWQIPNDKRYPW